MFIKKDLRKVDEILADASDPREELKLAKRAAEFQGAVRIICRENKISALSRLRTLNLYENDISSLDGIQALSRTPIQEINLGGNQLKGLPSQFSDLKTLEVLWLDDNQLEDFPSCLCRMSHLRVLRLTGNSIKRVPAMIACMTSLQTLALDNNELEEFPAGALSLDKLTTLLLRQNRIAEIPSSIDSRLPNLKLLSLSSNRLASVPPQIAALASLERLYLNGNKIKSIPESLVSLPKLLELNVANNQLTELPAGWASVWGQPDLQSGLLVRNDSNTSSGTEGDGNERKEREAGNKEGEKETSTRVVVFGNPFLMQLARAKSSGEQ